MKRSLIQRYTWEKYKDIAHLSPFKYIDYWDEEILEFLTSELGFAIPKRSWL